MINEKKFKNAMYALQSILVQARDMAYKGEDNQKLALLLDYLEYLPKMLVSKSDETEKFSSVIKQICTEFRLQYVLNRYNNDLPDSW